MNADMDAHIQAANGLLKKTVAELAVRNKELNCLYAISKAMEEQHHAMKEILQTVVNILPSAWQIPADTCARIIFEDQEITTDTFEETSLRMNCALMVAGQREGTIEIFRRPSNAQNHGEPFLKEEKELLEMVAGRLGKVIERRKTEAALQKSEQRFRLLVENAPTGISIVQNNQILYQNHEMDKLLGPLPRTHVLGDYENIHPDDRQMVMQANQDIQKGIVPKLDLDFRLIPAGGDIDNPTIKRVFCRVMLMEYQGKASFLVNIIDMTKITELEQLLFRQDKMASLGRVAAGIAHEIRNPLSGINIYLNTLEKIVGRPDSQPKIDQIIEHLKSASKKIESVIKKVMDFAKPGEPKFTRIQINKPIEDALNLTAVTLRKSNISVDINLDPALPDCYADGTLIEEAVLNLINNAAEAMRNMDADKKIVVSSALSDRHVSITVADTGPGVQQDLKDKVFDPFFTTKNDGTGIGLSICHRIASDHQGALTVGNARLGGAEFRLEIPIRKDLLASG